MEFTDPLLLSQKVSDMGKIGQTDLQVEQPLFALVLRCLVSPEVVDLVLIAT